MSAWLAAVLWLAGNALAQTPLPNPDLDLWTNGVASTLAGQPDGGLVFGGGFAIVDGMARNNLARIKPDGSFDTEWNPPPNSGVVALASGPDGAVYANSTFTLADGSYRTGLVKLVGPGGAIDPDWSGAYGSYVEAVACNPVDTLYAASNYWERIFKISMATGEVEYAWQVYVDQVGAIVVAADGALYVAGRFQSVNGVDRDRIAKVSATGQLDSGWMASLPGGINDAPAALAIGTDGNVFVGGPFGVLKLSGTTGAPMPQWRISAGDVHALAVAPGGSTVYVGGWFAELGGQRRVNLARLSSMTGLAVRAWDPAPDSTVMSLRTRADGRLDVGGYFDHVDGKERAGIATLSAQGGLTEPVVETLAPGYVDAVAARPDGSIIAGGAFIRADGLPRSNALRLFADGTLDPAWSPPVPFKVQNLAVDGNDSVYLVGAEASSVGHAITHIAKASGAGRGDIQPGWSSQLDNWLRTLAVDHQGALYVGGDFTFVNGVSRRSIAKLSTATGDPESSWDAMADCCAVAAIAIGANDKIYVGGSFAQIGGQPRHGLARLSAASGTADPAWNPNPEGSVYALAMTEQGDVYAGGQFATIGGQSRYLVAKLSGTGSGSALPGWDADLSPVYEPNYLLYNVSSIAIDAHGTAYLTGFFGVGHEPPLERSLARFSGGNGLVDLDWRPLPGGGYWNYAIAVAGDRLYVGGAFSQAGGQSRQGLAAFGTTLPDRLFAADFEERWPP